MTEEQRRIFAFQEIGDAQMLPTPDELEARAKKEARLKAEREWIALQVEENREKLAEEKQKFAELDFRQKCEVAFFTMNPNAEKKDFLGLYNKIREKVLIDSTVEAILHQTVEHLFADEMN